MAKGIEGHIEIVSADGVVHGWVRDPARAPACHVRILLGEHVLAETMAVGFRGDVLRHGVGHGHYGFTARLGRPLPPRACTLTMHLPVQDVRVVKEVVMPELDAPRARTVEDLLEAAPAWTTADLLSRPECLDMAAAHARLGGARFVDSVFRFVFARWPSAAEAKVHLDGLRAGRITPAALLVECLSSRERDDMRPELAGPYDSAFPFPL